MAPSISPLLEPIIESAPAWALLGARHAASAYPRKPSDLDDEFLEWFLGLTRPQGDGAPFAGPAVSAGAIATLSDQLPKLPDPEAVRRAAAEWANGDRHLSSWLAAGVPTGRALAYWGMSRLQSNQIPLAVAAFRAAVALTPRDPGAWSNYGVALDLAHSQPEASACLERSLFLSARQPQTWLQLGLVRKKLGDFAGAEVAYRTALELEPSDAIAWQSLGLLKEEQADIPAAIDCHTASIERGGGGPAVSANVGRLCYRIGRFAEARRAYAEAALGECDNPAYQFMLRKLTFIRHVLEGGSVDTAIEEFRKSCPEWNDTDQKEFRQLFETAFGVLSGFGHVEAARQVGRKHLELWAGDPTMPFLLNALDGKGVDRSPPAYIVEHFDRFADLFDSQRTGALGYDMPQRIGATVKGLLGGKRVGQVLDAGCGTGLCGPELRPTTRRLVGVDLSPRMLARAETRGMYDSLVCEDLVSFLSRSPRVFDLIVAADVMIYFGDLGNVLASAALATRQGGWLIFSTEAFGGPKYRLLPTGRFAHAPDYVQQAASPEFALHSCAHTTLRPEGANRVPGHLFVFRRL